MRSLTLILVLLITKSSLSQDFSGRATYKTHHKSSIKLDSTMMASNPGLKAQLEASMKKMFQKTFTLDFTNSESIYKEVQELDGPTAPQLNGVNVVFAAGGGTDVLFKSLKEKRMASKVDLMGKIFLIKDELVNYDWEMTGETKNIGKFTCYKAIFKEEKEQMRLEMNDGELNEEKVEVTITVNAWYTPDIPVSNGPKNYWGLPGLILEVNDGKQTIVCTEVILNSSEIIEIKEPKKGKQVSRKKFEEISRAKSQEMMNRFKSRDGKSIEIKIES